MTGYWDAFKGFRVITTQVTQDLVKLPVSLTIRLSIGKKIKPGMSEKLLIQEDTYGVELSTASTMDVILATIDKVLNEMPTPTTRKEDSFGHLASLFVRRKIIYNKTSKSSPSSTSSIDDDMVKNVATEELVPLESDADLQTTCQHKSYKIVNFFEKEPEYNPNHLILHFRHLSVPIERFNFHKK